MTKAFAVPTTIPRTRLSLAVVTDTLRAPANNTDALSELFDANGNDLGLEPGDIISITGAIGGDPAVNVTPLIYVAGAGGTTMSELLAKIKDNFKLPDRDGTVQNNLSVSLNTAGSDDNIPDGSIVIRGQPETAFAIQDVTIRATDTNNAKPSPNVLQHQHERHHPARRYRHPGRRNLHHGVRQHRQGAYHHHALHPHQHPQPVDLGREACRPGEHHQGPEGQGHLRHGRLGLLLHLSTTAAPPSISIRATALRT